MNLKPLFGAFLLDKSGEDLKLFSIFFEYLEIAFKAN